MFQHVYNNRSTSQSLCFLLLFSRSIELASEAGVKCIASAKLIYPANALAVAMDPVNFYSKLNLSLRVRYNELAGWTPMDSELGIFRSQKVIKVRVNIIATTI